jgi:hypothetical protein
LTTDSIVSFYSGGRDDHNRTLEAILAWPDDRLEGVHDYIQWVFPTDVPSGVNPFAPLVTQQTAEAFASSAELRDRLRHALDRMLSFYGLKRSATAKGDVVIAIDVSRFAERGPNWLRPGNHNHLRLTRILQCLWILGLRAEAQALQRCLLIDVYEGPGRGRIARDTWAFWKDALGSSAI